MKEGSQNKITAELTLRFQQNPINNDFPTNIDLNQPIRIKKNSRDSLFSYLNSNHPKDLFLDSHQHYQLHHFHSSLSDNDYYFGDSQQVQIMRLHPFYSESFEPAVKYQDCHQSKLGDQFYKQEPVGEVQKREKYCLRVEGNVDQDQSPQNLQPYSNYSQQNIQGQSQQTKQLHSRGLLVKNVTKNIGKLLFKFVWKNRITLYKKIKTDQETWEKFILMIRGSKKHNNVTRDFLMARFNGDGQQFRLMRVVAHHFFRKHCLAAVFRSKIKAKRVHFQRIKKFDQALFNLRALDYLV